MQTLNDVHQQFASLFNNKVIEPYAYLLSQKMSDGHICINLLNIKNELPKDFPYGLFEPNIQDLINLTDLVSSDLAIKKPFIIQNNLLYLQRYYAYESVIFKKILSFLELEKAEYSKRKNDLLSQKAFIKKLFDDQSSADGLSDEEKIDWQLAAATNTILNNFTIITGGPGTGKTTTVAKILAVLYALNPNEKVALAAPTGKAAMRMAESLRNATIPVSNELKEKFNQLKPYTIHRLLKFKKDSPYFKHNEMDPINYDTVIIDESSMMDVALFAKLISAIKPTSRLILLGDKNQLASVEAGSIFGDLCETPYEANSILKDRQTLINSFIDSSDKTITDKYVIPANNHPLLHHIIELKRSRRFKGNEGIGKLSKSIIASNIKELAVFFDNKDPQIFFDTEYNTSLFENFILNYRLCIEEANIAEALKKINELRVLCAVRESEEGVYAMNKRIENILRSKGLIETTNEFYHNRPIIVTSNNYHLGLFNGDVGIIRNNGTQTLAWFEDSEVGVKSVLPGFITSFETVYAMTIHKSQGSEYNQVLVVLPKAGQNAILTRELFYTGVTRAKTKVIVQASKEVSEKTALERVQRVSGICNRFNQI
jgi:exodeoxyribonuclease V alpha subunit